MHWHQMKICWKESLALLQFYNRRFHNLKCLWKFLQTLSMCSSKIFKLHKLKLAELPSAASSLKIWLISERIEKRSPHDISLVAKLVEYVSIFLPIGTPPTHLNSRNTVLNVIKTGHFLDPPTQSFCWRDIGMVHTTDSY